MIVARSPNEERKIRDFIKYVNFRKYRKIDKTVYIKVKLNDVIHLKKKSGTYRIQFVYPNQLKYQITCKKWQKEKGWGQRDKSYEIIFNTDIKCLHGNNCFLNR